MKNSRLAATLVALIMPMFAFAQNEDRKWAIEGNFGPTFIKDKTDIYDPFEQKTGSSKYFGVEYYIPETHYTARLGYQSETLYLGSQSISADQQTVNLGGRWYPAPENWAVQPHVGLGANILVSEDNTHTGWQEINGVRTSFTSDIHSPRFALTPSVGFDLYFLSSVALYVDYSYNIGVNNKYNLTYSVNNNEPKTVRGHLNHGNLQLGLKVTFPFHFTTDDGCTILDSILMMLLSK